MFGHKFFQLKTQESMAREEARRQKSWEKVLEKIKLEDLTASLRKKRKKVCA